VTAEELLGAFDLPAAARVDRRIPKTLLLEHGARTAADKRRINEGIERATWVAALKPATVGVAAFEDEIRQYVEIAVVRLALRPGADLDRLVMVLHRAIPYPVVGVTDLADRSMLSLVHIRTSRSEAGRTVLDGPPVTAEMSGDGEQPYRAAVLEALALGRQPRATLFSVYQGWIDVVAALHAARRTGRFAMKDSAVARKERREALEAMERLEVETTRLRAAASRETQMAKQVELNLELKRAEAALGAAAAKL
jgi:hypothetical protein